MDATDERLAAYNQGRPRPVDRVVWSGVCLCGHAADDHHGAVVQDPALAAVLGLGVVPVGGCEFFGCNEEEGLDEAGELHCVRYVDAAHPDSAAASAWRARLEHLRGRQK